MQLGQHLKVAQRHVITAQLLNAIHLLHLSNRQLESRITEMAHTNPFLLYTPQGAPSHAQGTEAIQSMDVSAPLSLHDALIAQLYQSPLDQRQIAIATELIDTIDVKSGYLTEPLSDILPQINRELAPLNIHADLAELEQLLKVIQHLEPLGCGARNLQECLLSQLPFVRIEKKIHDVTQCIITHHLDKLKNRKYVQLQRLLKIDADQLRRAINTLRALNPYPTHALPDQSEHNLLPDVYVTPTADSWQVELNKSALPTVSLCDNWRTLIQQSHGTSQRAALSEQLKNARHLIGDLQKRNDTLERVSHEIVVRQGPFLEHGESMMQPMGLKEIGQALKLHLSTISRICAQKYIHTPRGIYPLKYFFSSRIRGAGQQSYSSTAVRSLMQQLIKTENPDKPLSDQKIQIELGALGIVLTRRTVTKYRKKMLIANSHERYANYALDQYLKQPKATAPHAYN